MLPGATGVDDTLGAWASRRLPEAQRTAFELMQRDGLSLREAAQALGTTENAIKLRAHRARTALRAAIDLSEDGVDSVAAGF